jgi:hypothetical protein
MNSTIREFRKLAQTTTRTTFFQLLLLLGPQAKINGTYGIQIHVLAILHETPHNKVDRIFLLLNV